MLLMAAGSLLSRRTDGFRYRRTLVRLSGCLACPVVRFTLFESTFIFKISRTERDDETRAGKGKDKGSRLLSTRNRITLIRNCITVVNFQKRRARCYRVECYVTKVSGIFSPVWKKEKKKNDRRRNVAFSTLLSRAINHSFRFTSLSILCRCKDTTQRRDRLNGENGVNYFYPGNLKITRDISESWNSETIQRKCNNSRETTKTGTEFSFIECRVRKCESA